MKVCDQNLLEISKVLSGELPELPFEIHPLLPFEEESGIRLSSVLLFGRVYDRSGFVRLSCRITAVLDAPCARCLAPVNADFAVDAEYAVATEETESEEETVLAPGKTIDLDALAQELLLVHLPSRLLCREDCKGLCTKCGKDLNEGTCECDHKEIDPRLAGLADFFK